jgi:hypothetical protein
MPRRIERWKPERTHATAYLLSSRIFINGDCLTTIGGFICAPYLNISASASDAQIGAALLRVLAEARVAPLPTDFEALKRKIARSENVQTWSNSNKGLCCSAVQMHGEIWILPTCRYGQTVTQVLKLKVCISENSTPEEVGRALRDGFRRCK